ncbi:MAG: DUF362 domain-containing protein [Candidatus Omnitrophica bacterium]|nr:DUF362 domain-containing protein [Candidatus Omnitrophota bacterium]
MVKFNGKVAVLKVDDYREEIIISKVKEALDNYFSFKELSPKNKILLKPNLLLPINFERAVTTHPVFVEAIGKIFKDKGFDVYIADNPSSFLDRESVTYVYRECGIENIAKRNDFTMLYPDNSIEVEGVPFSWWINDFIIINLPKVKTHSLFTLTCATKNLYGCIPGLYKSYLHKLYPKPSQLVEFIIKLPFIVKPYLNIADGIISLEGEGPASSGLPKKTGFIVIGDDVFYTDYVISEILGVPKYKNILIRKVLEKGILNLERLELFSEYPNYPIVDNFKLPAYNLLDHIPLHFLKLMSFLFQFMPKIDKIRCKACEKCLAICPKGAIKNIEGRIFIDYSQCILCMCCKEVCRFDAIKVKKSFLLRMWNKLGKILNK